MEHAAVVSVVALIATSFSNTISLGTTIIMGFLALGTLIGVMYGVKYKATAEAQAATIETLQANVLAQETRADIAHDEKRDLADASAAEKERLLVANADLREKIARLELLPDYSALQGAFEHHEQRAQERHEATLKVLTELVRKDAP